MFRKILVTGGLVAALALPTAAPALAASPGGGPAWSLAIQPAEVYAPPGTTSLAVTVQNPGRVPLNITTSTAVATDHIVKDPPTWATASPAAFTLRPGESRAVTVTLKDVDAKRPDVVVMARTAYGTDGNARVAGAVASRITFQWAPPHHDPLIPIWAWPGALVFLACLAMIIHYVRRARRETRDAA
jgi:hypothetical protein